MARKPIASAHQDAKVEAKSIDDRISEIDQLMSMQRIFPTADPWGQAVPTLGVLFAFFWYIY